MVHLAAQAGVRYAAENPHVYVSSNVTGTLHILEGCRHHGVEHLVFASTSSVYGANTEMPFSEHQSTEHPLTLYAATKKANEQMAHSYAHLYNIPCTGLRFFTVYGPWGRPDMALFLFTKAILAGEPIKVFNHGKHKRSFTYIDDIVEGITRILDKPPEADRQRPTTRRTSKTGRSTRRQPRRPVSNFQHRQRTIRRTHALHRSARRLPRQKSRKGISAAATRRRPRTEASMQGLKNAVDYQPTVPVEARHQELRRLVPGLLQGLTKRLSAGRAASHSEATTRCRRARPPARFRHGGTCRRSLRRPNSDGPRRTLPQRSSEASCRRALRGPTLTKPQARPLTLEFASDFQPKNENTKKPSRCRRALRRPTFTKPQARAFGPNT